MTSSTEQHASKTALVTGANAGLGFEAAAHLAEAGYGCVILACRTLELAEAARQSLAARVGSDPFETLAVDISSIESAQAASEEVRRRGHRVDNLLLNAGVAPAATTTGDAKEVAAAYTSAIVGHHIMALQLLDAGALREGAPVVIAGSESAHDDLVAIENMEHYEFATDAPEELGDNFRDAMVSFGQGARPEKGDGLHYNAFRLGARPEVGSGVAEDISSAFPYESHYQSVLGSRMHYVDEGDGDVFLLLHGNPTSSYLWRNIIPHLRGIGRVIAPDLIGMGRSDKPDIAYRFEDHARYLDHFVEALGLRNITLVLHDWGSGLGFHYAARNPDNIKAIAFMEAVVDTMEWRKMTGGYKLLFMLFRTPVIGWLLISVLNVFVNFVLPRTVVRRLGPEEMKAYRAPFRTVASRRPIRQWPLEIPFDGIPADVHEVVRTYRRWLEETELPKLMVHASPGAIITPKVAAELKATLKNLEAIHIGKGIRYLQEDSPHAIGEGIAKWYRGLGG